MEIVIGREGNQPFPIADTSVSRKHAIFRILPDGQYQLEDTNSAGGTYIIEPDGHARKIIKSNVTSETKVRLGEQFIFVIRSLIPSIEKIREKEIADKKRLEEENDNLKKFALLEQVYNDYLEEKINLQRKVNLKNFYRTLPSLVFALVFGFTMIMGNSEWVTVLKQVVGFLMIVFIGISTFQIYNAQKDQPAQMEELNKKFMIKYVCPKCGNFLGFVPFESQQNKKTCPACKCKWV